jgi:hypothetical protein
VPQLFIQLLGFLAFLHTATLSRAVVRVRWRVCVRCLYVCVHTPLSSRGRRPESVVWAVGR